MNTNNTNALSYLDKIRANNGANHLKIVFNEMGQKHKNKAVHYINDKSLSFSTLFILIPEIKRLNLNKFLNSRNNIAFSICEKLLNNLSSNDKYFSFENARKIYPVLKWIFESGAVDDGLSNKYDKILDYTVALLITIFKDKTILPKVADMIFTRTKKGYFTHDLVWSFFQCRNPYTLKLIAKYLRSNDPKDVEIACELLNIEQKEDTTTSSNNENKYSSYKSWLDDNYSFLYFTGESFQLTSSPMPFDVDLEAKYLCKISSHNRKIEESLTEKEKNYLEDFKKLDSEKKILLSNMSHAINKESKSSWDEWMSHSIDKQINIAKTSMGGEQK